MAAPDHSHQAHHQTHHSTPRLVDMEADDPYADIPRLDKTNLSSTYCIKAVEYEESLEHYVELLLQRAQYFKCRYMYAEQGSEQRRLYGQLIFDTGALHFKACAWSRDVKVPVP